MLNKIHIKNDFFVASGFLLYRNGECERTRVVSQIKRILKLYLVWSIIYLPLSIREIARSGDVLNGIINYSRDAIFSGTYYHVMVSSGARCWYWDSVFIEKKVHDKAKILAVVVALFVIGLFGDSWNCWIPESVDRIYDLYKVVFVTTTGGMTVRADRDNLRGSHRKITERRLFMQGDVGSQVSTKERLPGRL